MAVKDKTRKPYIQDNDTNVKVGISLPIHRGVSNGEGFFATTSTTIEAVKNNIKNLLQTEEGERLFQPNLGIGLRKLLFEQITDENLLSIQDLILDKLEFWLPFVEVRNIEVLSRDDNIDIRMNEIRVRILFNLKQDPNTLDSVSLDFSSDILETESLAGGGGSY
jgi:phage baseplate assembly protein W|tara:strand:- start:167 stop:661 length:495 start_codon:yes stop_codon:yes gene_type:complete